MVAEKNNSISPFQIRAFKISHFDLSCTKFDEPTDNLQSEYVGHIDSEYNSEESYWMGMVLLSYTAKSDKGANAFSFEIDANVFCIYHADNTEKQKEVFENILKKNAAITLLTIMRSRVSSLCALAGYPMVMMPNINLNEFEWLHLNKM